MLTHHSEFAISRPTPSVVSVLRLGTCWRWVSATGSPSKSLHGSVISVAGPNLLGRLLTPTIDGSHRSDVCQDPKSLPCALGFFAN